jgi:hypothetical protein
MLIMLDTNLNQYESLVLMPDEQVIENIEVMGQELKKSRLIIGIILVIFGILISFNVLFLMFGIILIIAGLVLIFRRKYKEKISPFRYIITNKRAIIAKIEKGNMVIVNSCNLIETTPSLRNVAIETLTVSDGKGNSSTTQFERGDIIFIKDGKIVLEFNGIPSPKEKLNTIETIIKSSMG